MYAIIDRRMPMSCRDGLVREGFEVISLPTDPCLSSAVSGHPDMLLFFGDRILCRREYYNSAAAVLDRISELSGLSLELTDEPVRPDYPHDILFNAVRFGERIFCRTDAVSSAVRAYAERARLTLVHTRQGYAKCSVCAVTDRAAITADLGLAKALRENGIDVLTVEAGHITLPGLDAGFIGGASGVFGESVYFCGSLDTHPDGARIKAFCQRQGKRAVSLSGEPLFDAGTIFFI